MFTSRLPISTSVRRPKSQAEGSTSFVASNRPSNVPLTVRKANLFTPQTKINTHSGTSTAGKSYLSTGKKFQRALKPAPDRDEQIAMFDNLVGFLSKHNYPSNLPDNKRFFSSISTTESLRLFQFLIGLILPEYKINRLESDVPECLALLEYPFVRSVTKSALVSVATRQACIGLLVIFDWLIKEYNLEQFEPEDDPTNERLLIHKYGASRELFEKLHPTEDLESKKEELEDLNSEILGLERDLEEREELQREHQTLLEDIQKCAEYEVQIQKYIDLKRNSIEEVKQQTMRLKMEEEDLTRTKERLLLDIRSHELNIDEVRKNRVTLDQLESEIKQLQAQLNDLQQDDARLRSEHEKSLEDLKKRRDELKIPFQEMLKLDFDTYIKSDLWTERKLEFRAFLTKLEQTPYDDTALNQRIFRELNLFSEKLRATNTTLESQVTDAINNKTTEVESLEADNRDLRNKVLPRLEAEIKEIHEKIEAQRQQFQIKFNMIEAQTEEERSQIIQLKRKLEENAVEHQKKEKMALERINYEKDRNKEMERLNIEHLTILMQKHVQKAKNLVAEAERTYNRWEEVRKVTQHNHKVVMNASKVFRKKIPLG